MLVGGRGCRKFTIAEYEVLVTSFTSFTLFIYLIGLEMQTIAWTWDLKPPALT